MQKKTLFNYCTNSDRFDMALAPRFSNGDVAQMVEHTLTLQEVHGSMPRISNFSEEPGNQKKEQRETFFSDQKKTDMCVQYATVSVRNRTEHAEKAIAAPNRQSLPHMDVEENITLLIRESKTSLWDKQHHWTPPARHVNRKSKRLACEKHMDW